MVWGGCASGGGAAVVAVGPDERGMRGDAGRWGLANDSPGGAASSRSRSTYEVGKSCIGAAGLPRRPCECSPSVGEPGADICFVQYLVVTRFARTRPHTSAKGNQTHAFFFSIFLISPTVLKASACQFEC